LAWIVDALPTRDDREGSSIIDVVSYDLLVDLEDDAGTFASRAEIRFRGQQGSPAYADLESARVRRAELNGMTLDLTEACQPGRLELQELARENVLIVEAEFRYVRSAAGLHRQAGPDGRDCVYSRAYPGGAPRIYCCFDGANSRAPFTVSIRAPAGWCCLANGPVASRPARGDAGVWTFAATHPIAPYLSGFCAGRFSGPVFTWERDGDRPVPISASALPTAAAALEAAVSPELFQQPLAFYERSLGARYPYGKCDVVFVPGYPGLAFGAPGLVTIKDQVITEPEYGRSNLYLAIVIAHELAHAWLGGLINFHPPGAGWLEEAITTYVSRTAIEESHPGATLWAEAASKALPDHAYAANATTIRQLEHLIGRQAVLKGFSDLLHRHAHGSATKDDLVQCWSRAAARDLREWAAEALIPITANAGEAAP
jgi:aminopeptidase N